MVFVKELTNLTNWFVGHWSYVIVVFIKGVGDHSLDFLRRSLIFQMVSRFSKLSGFFSQGFWIMWIFVCQWSKGVLQRQKHILILCIAILINFCINCCVEHNQILVKAPGMVIVHSEDSPCQVMHLSEPGGLMSSVLNNHHCNISGRFKSKLIWLSVQQSNKNIYTTNHLNSNQMKDVKDYT